MLDCGSVIEESMSQVGLGVHPKASALSLVQIWDLISGTCDTQPYDRAFLATIARALAERCGSGPLRILDLGGGAGNPSVGLAEYGHSVDLVDVDHNMCAVAVERSRHVQSTLRVVHQDWREYLASAQIGRAHV